MMALTESKTFDREQVRNWVQDASSLGLDVEDSLPDDLVATAQALGLTPAELRLWIFEEAHLWTPAHLTTWARAYGCGQARLFEKGAA
jgi:hypothetical protein